MKRMLNCPNEVMEDLCHDESWYEIIKQRNHVRISGRNPIDIKTYVKDQPRNVWEILDRDGVRVYENSSFVNDAHVSPSKMLQHPSDLYVYTQETAQTNDTISKFGVMVTSSYQKNSRCLKRTWKFDTEHGEEYSWKDFLQKFHTGAIPPSNSLVFIDRYLFSYNSEYRTDYRNGIRNVYAILEELLPPTFSDEYHILIVFDDSEISRGASLADVVKDLQKIKREIHRPYIPTIEVLTVNSGARDVYAETHDRRIISNYFTLHATHGFSAFQPEEGDESQLICRTASYSTWSQRLSFESIFAGIDNEDQDMSSLPVRMNENVLSILSEYIEGLKGNDNGFHYVCNGNNHVDISTLKNRLIKEQL